VPLSVHNYAKVLRIIGRHEKLLPFEKLCQDLTDRCVQGVTEGWKSAADCIQFMLSDHQDDQEAKMMLMQKMNNLLCFSCSPPALLKECQEGKQLSDENCANAQSVQAAKNLVFDDGSRVRKGTRGLVESNRNFWKGGGNPKFVVLWEKNMAKNLLSYDGIVISEH